MAKRETAVSEDMLVEEIDIERIMQDIRKQILEKQARLSKGGQPIVRVDGSRFSPEFYEHLYYAGLSYDQVGVKMNVTPVKIPVFGPVIEWLRGKLHELTLYYVNQVAKQQVEVNTHLIQALSIMAHEMEEMPVAVPPKTNPLTKEKL